MERTTRMPLPWIALLVGVLQTRRAEFARLIATTTASKHSCRSARS